MQGNQIKRLLGRGGAGAAAAAGVGTLILAFSSTSVTAAGNPHFHDNTLAATSPTGFIASPSSYDLSHGAVTIDFNTVVRNKTSKTQTMTLNFSWSQILVYNGQNVADGQPGQPGLSFKVDENATEKMLPGTQTFTTTWESGQSQTISRSFSLNSCGYFQIDIWAPHAGKTVDRHRETLASGFVRALGCATTTSTPPSPSPVTTPATGHLNVTVPSTGASLGGEGLIGALLLIAGAGLFAASARRRRMDI